MSKVFVGQHPVTGKAVNPARKNDNYKTVMLQQKDLSINGTFMGESKKACFLTMSNATFESFTQKYGELQPGQEFPITGKLVVTETTVQSAENQKPKINPETQAVITHSGLPVYRNTEFTTDMAAQDVLLRSDNASMEAGERIVAIPGTNLSI